ncbi:hypothetical protein E2C01_051587 [Portunus trituberculatus]|uniref:Uncharacterized protein n=1 Tax=Portunus trituberculatus TaxID=210409 RepID=A0A5B7GJJ1_PORTR|nr:hypothetical protein [Portunus trituberculatus]
MSTSTPLKSIPPWKTHPGQASPPRPVAQHQVEAGSAPSALQSMQHRREVADMCDTYSIHGDDASRIHSFTTHTHSGSLREDLTLIPPQTPITENFTPPRHHRRPLALSPHGINKKKKKRGISHLTLMSPQTPIKEHLTPPDTH